MLLGERAHCTSGQSWLVAVLWRLRFALEVCHSRAASLKSPQEITPCCWMSFLGSDAGVLGCGVSRGGGGCFFLAVFVGCLDFENGFWRIPISMSFGVND